MKSYLKKLAAFFTSLCVLISCFGTGIPVFAAADMVKASVTADSFVYEDTTAKVTVSLEGIPYGGKTVPTDVVLIIDRSGSMSGKLDAMKSAAKSFVSKVDLKTHRIGVVSYGSESVSFPLSANSSEINSFLSTISLDGTTNMNDAIDNAVTVLADKRKDAVGSIVLMTDGVADDMNLAMVSAEKAKAKGYNFFTVALCDSETSVANQNLKKMATSETDHYSVFETSKLSQVYNSIADKIGNCTAKNVVITQTAGKDFTLVSGSADDNIPVPTQNGNTFTWKIPQLSKGISTLSYEVAPKAGLALGSYEHGTGTITYEDYDGNTQTITLDPQMIELKLHPPMITDISPKLYDGKSEKTITISGKYFTTDAKLYLDNVLTPVKSQNENSITFTAPVHDDGKITLKVVNSDGQSDTDTLNVGPLPVITNVNPNEIYQGTSVRVRIDGLNFIASKINTQVTVGGYSMTVASIGSDYIVFSGTSVLPLGTYSIIVKTANGGYAYASNALSVVTDPDDIPTITSVSPDNCTEGENVRVRINGKGFTDSISNTKVIFNGTEMNIVSKSDTYIIVNGTDNLSLGAYDISVSCNNMSDTLTSGFTVNEKNPDPVPAIKIISIAPNECKEGESVRVRIDGENFTGSKIYNKVTIGGESVVINSASKTYLVVTAPKTLAAGTYDVVVTNKDGSSATKTAGFTVTPADPPIDKAPKITNITPNECAEGASLRIKIEGENFTGSKIYDKVTIGGVSAVVNSANSTSLVVTVPAGLSVGKYDVVVTNKDNASDTAADGFTVVVDPASIPEITSVSPNVVINDTATRVRIDGKNFSSSKSGNTVTIGGTQVTVNSASVNYVVVTVPAGLVAGSYDIELTNDKSKSCVETNGITVKDPDKPEPPKMAITSISPAETTEGNAVRVRIDGENFTASKINNTVKIGDEVVPIASAGTTYLVVTVPATLAAGKYDVTVTDKNGNTAVSAQQFEVTAAPPPEPTDIKITGISINSITAGTSARVRIDGENFTGSKIYNKVTIGGVQLVINSASKTYLVVTLPNTLAAGVYDVVVENKDGSSATLAGGMTVLSALEPEITGITPSSCIEHNTASVVINGKDFANGVKVVVGTSEATVQSSDNTSIKCTFPALAAGEYNVVVTNPDGTEFTLSKGFTFEYASPEITSISPNTMVEGESLRVRIEGENFTNSKTGSKVTIGGQSATINSAGTGYLVVTPSETLAPGKYDVAVTNNNGKTGVAPKAFEVTAKPSPVITNISPSSVDEGNSVRVKIEGNNFTGSKINNKVTIGGVSVVIDSASKTSLVVTVPPTLAAGSHDVVVTNQDGTAATRPGGFTVIAKPPLDPQITDITPASGIEYTSVSITIQGKDFADGVKVTIGKTAATVTSSTKTSIKCNTPALSQGDYDVVVTNPDGTAFTLTNGFTFEPAPPPVPIISSISPNTTVEGTSVRVRIEGENLPNSKIGNKVTIGGENVTINSVGSNYVVVTSPNTLKPGKYDIAVTNKYDKTTTVSEAFEVTEKPVPVYPDPVITNLSVNSVAEGVATRVRINGENFTGSKIYNKVTVGGVSVVINSASKTYLVVTVPNTLSSGTYDIIVTNQNGKTATYNGFTILPK